MTAIAKHTIPYFYLSSSLITTPRLGLWLRQTIVDHKTCLSHSVTICFTERSKAVLLLWNIFVNYVSCLSRFLVCSLQPCGHLLVLLSVMVSCVFVTFPCGILGYVWYLIVSVPDLCLLTYF